MTFTNCTCIMRSLEAVLNITELFPTGANIGSDSVRSVVMMDYEFLERISIGSFPITDGQRKISLPRVNRHAELFQFIPNTASAGSLSAENVQ